MWWTYGPVPLDCPNCRDRARAICFFPFSTPPPLILPSGNIHPQAQIAEVARGDILNFDRARQNQESPAFALSHFRALSCPLLGCFGCLLKGERRCKEASDHIQVLKYFTYGRLGRSAGG